MLIEALDIYSRHYKKDLSESDVETILKKIENIKQPGLNEILLTYKAPSGINPYKEKFHQIFEQGSNASQQIQYVRPINKEYVEYSAWDVRDLIFVRQNMLKKLQTLAKKLHNLNTTIINAWVDYLSNEYIKSCFQDLRELIEFKICNKNPQIFSNIRSILQN